MKKTLKEIKKFAGKYQISFQFWGEGENNGYIEKNDVEIYSTGGHETPEEVMGNVLNFLKRINREV